VADAKTRRALELLEIVFYDILLYSVALRIHPTLIFPHDFSRTRQFKFLSTLLNLADTSINERRRVAFQLWKSLCYNTL